MRGEVWEGGGEGRGSNGEGRRDKFELLYCTILVRGRLGWLFNPGLGTPEII